MTFACVIISTVLSSQNVIKLGDEIISTDNMDKTLQILTYGGMVIEPIEDMFGCVSDRYITTSNGSDAENPIFCKVERLHDHEQYVLMATFMLYYDCPRLEDELEKLGYELFEYGGYVEYIFPYDMKHFKKGKKNVRISYPDYGGKLRAIVEFMLDRSQEI